MTPDVAIVVSPRPWAEGLHRFVADHGGAHVRARVLDGREALDEHYDVLVVDDITSFLTPRLVAEVHRRERWILGIHDVMEPAGADHLRRLGVDDVLSTSATPEDLLRHIDALVLSGRADLDRELAVLSSKTTGTARFDPVAPSLSGRAPGVVTVVGGPPGGGGITETAIMLAATVATTGRRTALLDLDEVAPAIANRLGLPIHPNLRTLVDVVQRGAGELRDAVQRGPAGVVVVAGARGGTDAAAIRPGEVVDSVDELARTADHVIVDVGHRLEDLAGFGTVGRYARARALLERADGIVAVAGGSPVAMARLLDWVADVRVLTRAPIDVVVNRLVGGRFQRAELQQELERSFSPRSVTFVPEDRRIADAAWDGVLAQRGPAVKAWTGMVPATLQPAAVRP